jgi:hypothetical protein
MSRRQGLVALAVALMAAILCLGVASWDDPPRERNQSLYTCNVWNDRSWAGCP